LKRACAAGLSWPLPTEFDDAKLNGLLFPEVRSSKDGERPQPNCIQMREELKKKGVTLLQLWTEYRDENPLGYGLSQFCDIYKRFNASLAISMRQDHKAGHKAFSDFAGTTLPIVVECTGVVTFAHLFVCTLGASNYTFAKLYRDETSASWCNGHADAFAFFCGTPVIVVPDNPKAVIIKASRYEPEINSSFAQMAAHFDVVVIPARVRRPQDKAKVEAAVGLATRWILAALRKQTFFSLAEANEAVAQLLARLNQKRFQKRPGSRLSLFEELDKPALRPLPSNTYEFCEFKSASINMDYHFVLDQHMYSVPFKFRFAKVELRITDKSIEVLLGGSRIASHVRKYAPGKFTTLPEHQPRHHRDYGNWSPEAIVQKGMKIGPATADLFAAIMASRPVAEQGFRSCKGILRLEKPYGKERLEAACARSLAIRGLAYKTVSSILKAGLESHPLPEKPVQLSIIHSHLREVTSFHSNTKENNNANSSNDRQSQDSEIAGHGQCSGESGGTEKYTGA
jgi:transposase